MTTHNLEYFDEKMNGLESLDINGYLIGDTGARCLAEALRKNNTVSWLDIQYNGIGPEVIRHFCVAHDIFKCEC